MRRITLAGVRIAAALALTCAATSSFAAPGWCQAGKTVKLAQITW